MRKITRFLLLSFAVHLLLIGGFALHLPQRTSERPPPLQVRLMPSPRVKATPQLVQSTPPAKHQRTHLPRRAPATIAAATPIKPVAEPQQPATDVRPSLIAVPPPGNSELQVAATPPSVAPPGNATSLSSSTIVAADGTATSPQNIKSDSAPQPDKPVEILRLPPQGEISYSLYYGAQRFEVGRTVQRWEITGDRYHLSSFSETGGLARLFVSQSFAFESRGDLTATGLRPESFSTRRTRSGTAEEARAEFDWTTMNVAIGNPAHSIALPPAAQDVVSFMYQLSLMRLTPGRIELPITNGWKMELRKFDVGAEEDLKTVGMGTLRVLPIRQVRQKDEESMDLWLAPDYKLLPVRIVFFNRQGEASGEQLVNKITVSNN